MNTLGIGGIGGWGWWSTGVWHLESTLKWANEFTCEGCTYWGHCHCSIGVFVVAHPNYEMDWYSIDTQEYYLILKSTT